MKRWWQRQFHKRWADELDFIGPRVRTSVMGWALLALGLVAALHAAELADQSEQALADAQAVVKRLERGARQQAVREQVVSKVRQEEIDAAPTLNANGWRHAAQLALWLGYPWHDTLAHVDETAFQEQAVMTLLSLDLSTLGTGEDVQPEMKLQAAVRSDVAALQWMQALGPQASLRSRERLTTPFSTARGSYEWRVDVVMNGGRP